MVERTDYGQDIATEEQPRSETIRRDIESTRASLDEKLGALQNRVRDVQTKAKQAFDLNHQIAAHPWTMFGASIAAGFGLGLVVGGGDDEEHHWRANPTMFDQGQLPTRSRSDYREERMPYRQQEYSAQYAGSFGYGSGQRGRSPRGDIFETVKLAAGAAVMDLLRQSVNRYLPQLGTHLDRIWQEKGLTPVSAASALFTRRPDGEGSGRAHGNDASPQSGRSPVHGAYGSTSFGSAGPDPARNFDPSAEMSQEPVGRAEATTRS
jgi:hypothetical protein